MFEREAIPRPQRRIIPIAGSGKRGTLARDASSEQSPVDAAAYAPAAGFDFGDISILPPQPEVGPEGGELDPALANRIQAQQGGGTVLDPATRTNMESGLGHNFADVRIHTDGESDTLNRSLGARAFTLGSDIYLSQEAASAGTNSTDQLLAHELTHVVQQRGTEHGGPLSVEAANDPHEQEASAVAREVSAERAVAGIHAAPRGPASIAPARVQREVVTDEGPRAGYRPQGWNRTKDSPPPGPKTSDTSAVAHDVDVLKKQQAAMQLDARWRAKFGERMANYKQAVWRITGAMDAAVNGFQDAQVAQAQTDQLIVQLIGLAISVGFAAGFEWVFVNALGKVGQSAAKAEQIANLAERVENPANAAVGGTATNIAGAVKAQEKTAEAPGGGALAFLADRSEQLEQLTQKFEQSFIDRSTKLSGYSSDQWERYDPSAQEKTFQDLFDELNRAGSGVEKLKPKEELALIVEKTLWATWLKSKNKYQEIRQEAADEYGAAGRASAWLQDWHALDELPNLGSDINERLNKIGVADEAGVGLYEHWYERNSDAWDTKLMNWARNYNKSWGK